MHPNNLTSYRLYLNDSLLGGWLNDLQVNPVANNQDSLVFRLELSLDGCLDTAFQRVDIFNDQTIYFPNSFTPNGDGVNDVFKPSGNNVNVKEFLIYNRWGELMHDESNIAIEDIVGWNGTAKPKSSVDKVMDVYIYRLLYESGIGSADNKLITGAVYAIE